MGGQVAGTKCSRSSIIVLEQEHHIEEQQAIFDASQSEVICSFQTRAGGKCRKYRSLGASSLEGGGREGERGKSLQRCLMNFHFSVEKVDAKCGLVDIEFGAYVIALRGRRVDNTKMVESEVSIR